MSTNEIVSLIGVIFSAVALMVTLTVFFNNAFKDKFGEGGKSAKIESKIDFIKIQTELINAQNKEISSKLDSQNDRLIVVEQTVETAKIKDLPATIARIEETLKSNDGRITDIETRLRVKNTKE